MRPVAMKGFGSPSNSPFAPLMGEVNRHPADGQPSEAIISEWQPTGLDRRTARSLTGGIDVKDSLLLPNGASGCPQLQLKAHFGDPHPGQMIFSPGSLAPVLADAGSVVPGRKIRVLVVEDEALIALVLGDILEELGFDVCASEMTEADAVKAAIQHRPGLMIVDARLRQGSGIAAVATILRDQFTPHVFVSGDRLLGAGLHPRAIVLQKPFLDAELALAIQHALGHGLP